jgi:formiminotetrahydrofolate cyclodeaminase
MSSVSNFERNKPKKTYTAIKAMKKYIYDSTEELQKEELQRLIDNIEKAFLSGE